MVMSVFARPKVWTSDADLQGWGISGCNLQAIVDLEACFIWYSVLFQRVLQIQNEQNFKTNTRMTKNYFLYLSTNYFNWINFTRIHLWEPHLASEPVDFSPIENQVFPHELIAARDENNKSITRWCPWDWYMHHASLKVQVKVFW